MHRTKPGGGWTLLYLKKAGSSTALAQVELQADTDLAHLRAVLLPELADAMKKREPWRLAFHHAIDEAPWLDHAASERHLSAAAAWLDLQRRAGATEEEALRRLAPHTLDDTLACLLDALPRADPARLDWRALSAALETWRRTGTKPAAIETLLKKQ